MAARYCVDECGREITASFGFVTSDTYLKALRGETPMTPEYVKELCGICAEKRLIGRCNNNEDK